MKILLYCLWGILLPIQQTLAQLAKPQMRTGQVTAAGDHEPLAGATLMLTGSRHSFTTDEAGNFTVPVTTTTDTLIVSYIGFTAQRILLSAGDRSFLIVTLAQDAAQPAAVVVSTGYQWIPKERATGSFVKIDNALLTRSTSTGILDRLENVTSGLVFNRGNNQPNEPLAIRGRSTIFSNTQPLVVLDNFPYDGNINNINPNDIESITVLKDAAAAAIWGVKAGNGVIVITSRTGKSRQPAVTFSSNTTQGSRPDIFNLRTIAPGDYIELEKYLYAQGYYDNAFTDPSHPPVTPVVQLLHDGAASQVNALKNHDARSGIAQYLYRAGLNLQNHIEVSGNGERVNYCMSAGWDKNLSALEGAQYNRVTMRSQNSFRLTDKLSIDAALAYTQSNNTSGDNPGYTLLTGSTHFQSLYPYARLVDNAGNAQPVYLDYNSGFIQQAQNNGLLNWGYTPVSGIGNEINTQKVHDLLLTVGAKYRISKVFQAEFRYQYESQLISNSNLNNDSSWYARNLVNRFTQVDPVSGTLSYPIPVGGILDIADNDINAHQGRVQLSYNQAWGQVHQVSAIAGWEIKNLSSNGAGSRVYGYNRDGDLVTQNMDFISLYQQYNNPFLYSQVENPQAVSGTLDRFLSYYANVAYTYKGKYTFSGSAREDASNLFGVKTNQQGVPLWSAGFNWKINPAVKLRASYGVQGNFSRATAALTTALYSVSNVTGLPTANIKNPPNERLRWEKDRMLNLGLDFSLYKNILSGSLEYYHKNAVDLMGNAPVDPTIGLSDNGGTAAYFGNVASLKGRGVDLQLEARLVKQPFSWQANFLFSYASSWVTGYSVPATTLGSNYLNESFINPVIGKPVYSLYAYKWAGLDPATGDPRGWVGGKASNDYSALLQVPLDSMVYKGPLQPTVFGALRNTFTWHRFSLSFNISYKLGYYFRKPSVNYTSLFSSWNGSADYAKRWQKPGDENTTDVPSLTYPADNNRDQFYTYSEVLVEKADNIRLEDITAAYQFSKIKLYVYAYNLGLLWSANKDRIDPYYINSPKTKASVTLGINISF